MSKSEEDLKKQMHGLVDAAIHFNSYLTQVIGRDNDEKLLFVAVIARGEDAIALEKWLKGRAAREAKGGVR
jgi:hypothetical protein